MARRPCTVADCDRPQHARGLCESHYAHERRRVGGFSQGPPKLAWLRHAIAAPWPDECIDWPFATGHGYGKVSYRGVSTGAHVVACELSHGPAPTGLQAGHRCGRRICINPAHLRWVTVAENSADRIQHGTHTRGERSPTHLLTTEQVRAIRRLAAEGVSRRELGERFGVSKDHIGAITRRDTWSWLDPEPEATAA